MLPKMHQILIGLAIPVLILCDFREESEDEVSLRFSPTTPGGDVEVTCRFYMDIRSKFVYLVLYGEADRSTAVAYAEIRESRYSVQWWGDPPQTFPWMAGRTAVGGSWRNRNLVLTIRNWRCGETYEFYCGLIYDLKSILYEKTTNRRRLGTNCTGTSGN